jgi:hypothetical protein
MSDTIEVYEKNDEWWLWDTTRKMNLSMRAKSKEDAYIKAIHYYQKRLLEVEVKLFELNEHIDKFVAFVRPEDSYC